MKKSKMRMANKQAVLCFVLSFGFKLLTAQLANWAPVPGGTNFPTNVSGQINGFARISQMKFHPSNNNKYYCVTAEGGLFLSNDQAATWTVAPGTETITNSCAAICIDYTNDQNLFLGTGDANYYSNGAGIFKSANGGISFSPTSLVNCLVVEILQNPSNAQEFVAATNKGIYKSTNAGLTWAATTATNIPFCDLISNAAVNSQTLYAASRENVPKFMRSTDFGSTWTQTTAGIVSSSTVIQSGARIAVCPSSTNVVYFSVIGDGGIMHKSNDNGLSFNVKKAGGSPFLTYYSNTVTSSSQGNYNHAITVDRADPSKVWLQAHNTWFSADSGATWTMQTFWANTVHTDMHQIMQAPFDNSKLYSCNDGGVWLSTNGGTAWSPKSHGLYAYEIGSETGVSSLIKKDFVSIGTQDNGKLYSDMTGWFTIGGGDDYAKRQCDYNGHIYFDGLNRQLNHTGASATYNLPTTNWNVFAFNRNNPNLAFMGYSDIYRTVNLNLTSPTWTPITNNGLTIYAAHSPVADPNRLYYLVNGTFYGSTNALATNPTFTSSTFPNATTVRGNIVSMANNANIVYVMSNNAVYYSTNAGVSWTNVTYNLPNVNHRRIIAETYGGTQELVFVATNNAVYYKKAGQTSWTNYSSNLPARRAPTGFSMFDNGTNQSRIRYASYGRAIWESAFDNLRAFSAEILFNDTTITCSSPTIQFTDGSVGTNNATLTYTWNFPGGTPATAFTPSASVSYPSTGIYTISLTVKDGLNTVSTRSISKYIQVIKCNADTLPGNAIAVNGTANYATTPPIPLGNTNSITISAWIKIDVAQPSFAGIVFSPNGTAAGLNFRNGNQIGYHYNGLASTYNYAGGPVIPYNLWTHVALVTSASAATIFVNGVPYINNVANTPINFTSGFNLGNDRNNSARTMTGLMDEVCFYNRSLTQDEIRELMHLTKNHNVTDPSLKAYYQFNEAGNTIYDRAGSANALLNGTAQHLLSTAPVGSGNSERMTVSSPGVKVFNNEGLILNFPVALLPNGEICVTRLNIQPDSVATGRSFTNSAKRYWIVNNYGNPAFSPLTSMTLTGYGNVTAAQATSPSKFKLYSRVTGGYRASGWTKIDSAQTVTSGANAVLSFTGSAVSYFNTQFTVARDSCYAATSTLQSSTTSLCANAPYTLQATGSVNDNATWKWYSGACGGSLIATGNSIAITPTALTTYYYRGEGGCAANGSCVNISVAVKTPPTSPTSISGNTLVCAGSSHVFNVLPQAGATSYSWTLPGGWSGTSNSPSISVLCSNSGGMLQVSASNSCGTSPVATLSVGISSTVAATRNVNLCAGKFLQVGTSTYSASGTYTNLLTGANGCDSLLTSVIVVDAPVDTAVTNLGLSLSSNAANALYQWLDCDKAFQPVAGQSAKNFTPVTNGHYAVVVTVNNCVDTSACASIIEVGLQDVSLSQHVRIYPNPASNSLFIQVSPMLQSARASVYNALGQIVCTLDLAAGSTQQINLADYAPGIYSVNVEYLQHRFIQNVIKE